MLRGRGRNGDCFPRRHDGQRPEGSLVPGRQAMRAQGRGKVEGCQEGEAELPGVDMANIALAALVELATAVAVASARGSSSKAESLGFLGRGQSLHVSAGAGQDNQCQKQVSFPLGNADAVVSQGTWLAKVCLLMGCKAAGNLGQQHRISRNCTVTSSPRLEGNISDAQWSAVYASSM